MTTEMTSEQLQYAIVNSVYERGYDAGDAPRQLLKMIEEVGELARVAGALSCSVQADALEAATRAGEIAREAFDNPFDTGYIDDTDKAAQELADVIVTACCLAHSLGIDDIMGLAAEKAIQDLKRGTRA